MMSVAYLTFNDLMQIHDELVIARFGGSYGVLNAGALESVIAMPQQEVFGTELYADIPAKAGILFYLLVQNHCYVDGNKRTAVIALETFIRRNQYVLAATNDELFELAIAVATSRLDKDQTTDWIRAHMRQLS